MIRFNAFQELRSRRIFHLGETLLPPPGLPSPFIPLIHKLTGRNASGPPQLQFETFEAKQFRKRGRAERNETKRLPGFMASSKLSYVSTIRDDIPTSFTSKLSYTHLFSFLPSPSLSFSPDILAEDPLILQFFLEMTSLKFYYYYYYFHFFLLLFLRANLFAFRKLFHACVYISINPFHEGGR